MSPKLRVGLGALLISLCLDLLTKHLVLTHLHFGDKKPIIEGFFYLTHVRNPGAAFGLFATAPAELRLTFFIGISVLAIGVVLWAAGGRLLRTAFALLGFLFGAGIGWFLGHVVEFGAPVGIIALVEVCRFT